MGYVVRCLARYISRVLGVRGESKSSYKWGVEGLLRWFSTWRWLFWKRCKQRWRWQSTRRTSIDECPYPWWINTFEVPSLPDELWTHIWYIWCQNWPPLACQSQKLSPGIQPLLSSIHKREWYTFFSLCSILNLFSFVDVANLTIKRLFHHFKRGPNVITFLVKNVP